MCLLCDRVHSCGNVGVGVCLCVFVRVCVHLGVCVCVHPPLPLPNKLIVKAGLALFRPKVESG